MPTVRTAPTREKVTRRRVRGAVDSGAEARCPRAGARGEVRVCCISAPSTSVAHHTSMAPPPARCCRRPRAGEVTRHGHTWRRGRAELRLGWSQDHLVTGAGRRGGAAFSASLQQGRAQTVAVGRPQPQGGLGGIRGLEVQRSQSLAATWTAPSIARTDTPLHATGSSGGSPVSW